MKHLHLWLTFAGAATLAQFLGFCIPTIISWKLVNLGILNPDEPFVWMPLISLMLTACILSLLLIQLVLGPTPSPAPTARSRFKDSRKRRSLRPSAGGQLVVGDPRDKLEL